MVSPTQTDVSAEYVANRGFIPEETVVAAGPGNAQITYYRPFWRPVLAGSLFALSVFVLSWFLMLGCHVGITSSGVIALGGGAAVWLWVTACIAFFFGGMIASRMTGSSTDAYYSSAWLKGAVIWGFSIPLALFLYSWFAQSGGILTAFNFPHAAMSQGALGNAQVTYNSATSATGAQLAFYWCTFIGLALALIFSIVGSLSGCAVRNPTRRDVAEAVTR